MHTLIRFCILQNISDPIHRILFVSQESVYQLELYSNQPAVQSVRHIRCSPIFSSLFHNLLLCRH
nr:MAG TPA: hypothetical protein [Caudoviricetes sp.]